MLDRKIIGRETYLKKLKDYTSTDIIKVITGVRRCGKSSLLLMYKSWLEENFGEDSVLYIRFDGPEFILNKRVKAMVDKLKADITEKTRFLLFDEVQLIKGWEEVVNAYYSTGLYEITLTGSNADMLSSELSTLLTGRYTEIKMLPLSFGEYLNFKGIKGESIEKEFEEYILYGGFPITALLDSPEQKRDMLQSILDSILFNDVRSKIGSDANNESLIRLVAFFNDATGFPVLLNNLMHKIKSAGYKMYHDLIVKYVNAFKASYLYYNVEFHTIKGGERFSQVDKYYPVDIGLIALTKGNLSENYGSVLENIVFLELKRMGYDVSVGKNDSDSSEVDFIASKGSERIYVQVTASLINDVAREREFHALEEIRDNYPKLILSMDRHDYSKNGIKHMYIPSFLLSEGM